VKVALLLVGAYLLSYFGTALFERLAPRRYVRLYQKFVGNPLQRPGAGVVPGWAVIESIGRRSGSPHQVPVGGRLQGRSFWLVAGDGRQSQYVRNIEANPRVRLKIHGRWRTGAGHILDNDNPRLRLWRLNSINGLFVWIAGTELLTIRVDLDE
jgi:deazaflavin-dependent oxidoreductase (nitroreductase family)